MARSHAPVRFCLGLVMGLGTAALAVPAQAAHPWPARQPPVAPPPAHQLRDVHRWPGEPATPAAIDPARFRQSVDHLCARGSQPDPPPAPMPASSTDGSASSLATPLGDLVRLAAVEAEIDPFLLAGLMFVQSGCRAGRESRLGIGLLRIQPAMYMSPSAPAPPGEKEEWRPAELLDPGRNLRLGAKVLRMWTETHLEIDAAFGGVPHRGPVAHFVWGDVVRGSGAEDEVLTARRRMIAFYLQTPEPSTATQYGLKLLCPLEGAPRVAASGPGEDRDGGKRHHRGIDLAAGIGEPVRAVADGTVMFAGANVPGVPRRSIPPDRIARYRWRQLGPGGIYVCIEHAPERHVVTCYMHLDTFSVSEGEKVTAGQFIGRVGRTGVQLSPPHLHFELRVDDRFVDPARCMSSLVIPPKATQTYQIVMQAKRARLAGARAAASAPKKL